MLAGLDWEQQIRTHCTPGRPDLTLENMEKVICLVDMACPIKLKKSREDLETSTAGFQNT